MYQFLANLFDTSDFMPRWMCGNWTSFHGYLHIVSDLGTWAAYTAIPLVLVFFVSRRRDIPFQRIFLLFGVFILACGMTHLIEAIIFWVPIYRISAVVKVVTAIASWCTVFALIRIVPEALKLPGIMKLNEQLREEIAERKLAQSERERLLAREQAARLEAERTSRLKDDFLSTVSHEIRTPLNAILGWSQILRSPDVTPEDVTQGLEVIERNSRAQAILVDDLLDMSRIISGKVKLDIGPVDMAEIIRAATNSIRPAAEAKQIVVQELLDPSASSFVGDGNRIQQIVWNLLSNAVKFTPKNGTIRVSLRRADSEMELEVHDSGIGIAIDFLPYVFDRFSQADGSTTRRFAGLGLGLAIVKHLAELHGGTVGVASEGEFRGTTFTVRLPIKSLKFTESITSHNAPGLVEHAGLPNLAGVRILVVDDEPDSLQLVARIFRARGGKVHAAGSVSDAIKIMQYQDLDLMVSDIGMPGADGYELMRTIRNGSVGGAVKMGLPAIALTAFARPEDQQKAFAAGFHAHLIKPADAQELLKVAAALLEKR